MRYDFAERAREITHAHRSSVDLLVMLSHLGLKRDREVANGVSGIDLILSAHSHDLTKEPEKVGDTIIIQAGAYAEWVERLDLTFDLKERKVVGSAFTLKKNERGVLPVDDATQQAVEAVMSKYAPDGLKRVVDLEHSRDGRGIGDITAKAVLTLLKPDAAIVDQKSVLQPWIAGPLSDQDFVSSYVVAHQRPGTPPFTSFYFVKIKGSDLADIRKKLPAGWSYAGPDAGSFEADTVYRLAIQKHEALDPRDVLPHGVATAIEDPVYAADAWKLLDEYGRKRDGEGKAMDDGLPPAP
ncbi:MAG: hypothetical protein PHU25_04270 [Deltaproteobacteria bacterium]|nr:hypothetical protein [Deltaproteobacteria bacterium]